MFSSKYQSGLYEVGWALSSKASLISKHLPSPDQQPKNLSPCENHFVFSSLSSDIAFLHVLHPCPAPDLGCSCPHKASSLVETGHASSVSFLNDLKKNRIKGFSAYMLAADLKKGWYSDALWFSFAPVYCHISATPEMKAAKMGTTAGGLFCQDCRDLLHGLDARLKLG